METTLFHCNGRFLALPLLLLVIADLAVAQGQQEPPPPGYYSPNFSPSMPIVIAVLISAFFFLGFFSIYIRHCYGDGAGNSATALPNGTGAAARSRRQRGLDAAVLETFPTMAYADVKEHKAVKGALECAVCLSEFDDDETLRLLPKCSHVFHPDCIDTWLASHVTCPVCRANLVPDPDAPADDVPEVPAPAPQPQELSVLTPAPGSAPEQGAVVIDVEETEEEKIIREEAAELMRIGSVKRALRSKSSRGPARFPRSHSTGHSLAAPLAGASERFTLRLPDHVLREIVEAGKLQRTTSLFAFRAGREGSMRRGARAGTGEGSGRAGRSIRLGQSGRWPSFLSRTFSTRPPAWGSRSIRRGDTDGSNKGGKAAGAGAKSAECDDQACAPGQRV